MFETTLNFAYSPGKNDIFDFGSTNRNGRLSREGIGGRGVRGVRGGAGRGKTGVQHRRLPRRDELHVSGATTARTTGAAHQWSDGRGGGGGSTVREDYVHASALGNLESTKLKKKNFMELIC